MVGYYTRANAYQQKRILGILGNSVDYAADPLHLKASLFVPQGKGGGGGDNPYHNTQLQPPIFPYPSH